MRLWRRWNWRVPGTRCTGCCSTWKLSSDVSDVLDMSVRFVWMFCLLSNTREALSKKVETKFRPCTGRRQETAKSMLRWIVKWYQVMSVVFSYLCFGFVFSRGSVHLMVSKLFCWRESHLASLIRIQALHLSSQILLGREPALSLSCSLGSCTILHHSEEETVISPVVAVEAPFNLSSREGRAVTSGPGLIPSLQFFGEAGEWFGGQPISKYLSM